MLVQHRAIRDCLGGGGSWSGQTGEIKIPNKTVVLVEHLVFCSDKPGRSGRPGQVGEEGQDGELARGAPWVRQPEPLLLRRADSSAGGLPGGRRGQHRAGEVACQVRGGHTLVKQGRVEPGAHGLLLRQHQPPPLPPFLPFLDAESKWQLKTREFIQSHQWKQNMWYFSLSEPLSLASSRECLLPDYKEQLNIHTQSNCCFS